MRFFTRFVAGLIAVVLGVASAVAVGGCGSKKTAQTGTVATLTTVSTNSSPADGNGGVYTLTNGVGTATGNGGVHTVVTGPATTTTHGSGGGATGVTYCTANQLHPVMITSQGAAGTDFYVVGLKNISSQSCVTYGYPGVSFLNSAGSALPTSVTRTTSDMAGSVSARTLTVAVGAEVSFRVAVETAYKGGALCKSATTMRIYPPESTAALNLSLGGAGSQVCGEATVIPLQSGSSANPN